MNQDINTDFRGDIIKLMYTYVKFLGRFENETIEDINNKFIQSVEDNTFHNAKHEELILNIAIDMLLSQNTQNGITVDDDTVIDSVCRVKTNNDIVKPKSMNSTDDYYKKAKINKFALKDPTDDNLVHIKNKLMKIQNNLDMVEQLGLYLNLNDNEIIIELLLRYKK